MIIFGSLQPFIDQILSIDKDAVVVGGYIRDKYWEINPKDIDIILPNFQGNLDIVFSQYKRKFNSFGCIKVETGFDITADIWRLQDHNYKINTVLEVFDYVPLTCQQIMYHIRKDKEFCGMQFSLTHIDFVHKPNETDYFRGKIKKILDKAPKSWISKDVYDFVSKKG